jgi:hypothetical protein
LTDSSADRRHERRNIPADAPDGGPPVRQLHFIAHLLHPERLQVGLVDNHRVGQVDVGHSALLHVPRAADAAFVEPNQLDDNPPAVGTLPHVPVHVHPLGPRDAGNRSRLVDSQFRNRLGHIVERRRPLGHDPHVDSRMGDDG